MFKFLTSIFDDNKKAINRFSAQVDQINRLEPEIKKLSDKALAQQTKKFQDQIETELKSGKSEKAVLNSILPEVYATVREVSRRVIGLRHYDVQLIAGIALHEGTITE